MSSFYERADELLQAALDLSEEERPAFLSRSCGGDAALEAEVFSLLLALRRAGKFLETPIALLLSELTDTDSGRQKEDAEDSLVGCTLGPYRLEQEVGRGGMSIVYRASRVDSEYRQTVAVKVIKPGMDSAAVLRRFRAERQILANLVHPNVARCIDAGRTPKARPYLVMEHIEGRPIDRFCEEEQLDTRQRLHLFVQVCGAVQFAHSHLVVHRDLKPANILVMPDGTPKLLDFGVAKLLAPSDFEHTVEETEPGQRPMTPRFAAPEQHSGGPITTATDVYALGLLLHLLLVGRLPAEPGPGGPRNEVVLPDELQDVVSLALREEPGSRFGSVEQLAADVQRYLDGRPVLARRQTTWYRFSKLLRRHRAMAAVTVTAFLLSSGLSVLLAIQVGRAREALASSQAERHRAENTAEFLYRVFESADPKNSRGEEITARELLDRGAEQIEGLAREPVVQAAALDTLGRIYGELAVFDRAKSLLERGLQLRREQLGNDHQDVALSLTHLGRVLQKTAEFERAAELQQEALALRRRVLGSRHLLVAESLVDMASVHWLHGDYGDIEPLLLEALEIRSSELGEDHPLVALIWNELANLASVRGGPAEAEEPYRRALAVSRRALGHDHPQTASLLNNLALCLSTLGRHSEAIEIYGEALSIRLGLFGPDHPDVAMVQHNLASSLMRLERFAEAEKLLLGALATRNKVFGEVHPSIAANLTSLAGLHQARGDLRGAVEVYRQGIEVADRLFPNGHPALAEPLLRLGKILLELGDPRSAEVPLLRARELTRNHLPADHPLVLELVATLEKCRDSS